MQAFHHHLSELQKADKVSEVFDVLKDHLSFFNYDILEQIITKLGTEEVKDKLQTYNKEFCDYAKQKICGYLPQ